MPEIGTFGLMSGDGKQGDAGWLKPLRPSSTLPDRVTRNTGRAQCVHITDPCKTLTSRANRGSELLEASAAPPPRQPT